MHKVLFLFGCALLAVPALTAATIPVGFVSWDVTIPGSSGQFDIANETGPNSSGDPTAPVTSELTFSNLNLQIKFTNGSTETLHATDFSLNVFDGLSWESPVIQIGGANPSPEIATLTGAFGSTALTLFDSSQLTIAPNFTATIPDTGTALPDGDLAIINATASSAVSPEPQSISLCSVALALLLLGSLRLFTKRSVKCCR